jgi:hypothetical protein
MKPGFLTRLNILIASAVLTLTVGAANASPHRDHAVTPDKIPDKILDNIPVELALVLMFLAFLAGYGLRATISHVHRAKAGRDRHIDWEVASEPLSHIPTASSLFPPPRYGPGSGKSSTSAN